MSYQIVTLTHLSIYGCVLCHQFEVKACITIKVQIGSIRPYHFIPSIQSTSFQLTEGKKKGKKKKDDLHCLICGCEVVDVACRKLSWWHLIRRSYSQVLSHHGLDYDCRLEIYHWYLNHAYSISYLQWTQAQVNVHILVNMMQSLTTLFGRVGSGFPQS